ncbi:NAD(P)-dependent oxidoreductase [Salinispirillum sp. LH 10-3-1]|uniref:NAD(P)-dependent oxidoreductase n=1 Tax=Salinispirillum sp. LH 10-3-1 TaxID=2952525 RepID=A0AB38YIV4_9GAMM
MSDVTNVAFIGLGVMGYPMAGHLQRAGHKTCVYNRTTAKAEQWAAEYSGRFAPTPALAAQGAAVVCLCVGNDDDVRSVVYGEDGVLSQMSPGAVLVDHTTTSATLAEELASACAERQIHFIDAPVSGGQAGAENGRLTIMCGGEADVFAQVNPILSAYAAHIQLMGTHGQGQRCKMVNQVLIAGILQGLSEGVTLAQAAGLNMDEVITALQQGAAGSWQLNNRASTMAQGKFDFGFAIDWMRKDLGIVLDEAQRLGVNLPLAAETDQRYRRLQEQGFGRMDTSVLIRALKLQ